jgi:hypothetical protein
MKLSNKHIAADLPDVSEYSQVRDPSPKEVMQAGELVSGVYDLIVQYASRALGDPMESDMRAAAKRLEEALNLLIPST